ncbi:hypothetical protein HanPI659440_Chr13g0487421 [Helianthus annuus]|nr:hypothetical protein HanPI659440_Chr13g0487421 [Helianthus annuus]
MSSITGFNLSFRHLYIQFPAQSRRKIEYGCTCTAVRPVLCSTSSSVSHSDENHVSPSYSRRLMTFMITFLLPLPKSIQFSGADAWAAAENQLGAGPVQHIYNRSLTSKFDQLSESKLLNFDPKVRVFLYAIHHFLYQDPPFVEDLIISAKPKTPDL